MKRLRARWTVLIALVALVGIVDRGPVDEAPGIGQEVVAVAAVDMASVVAPVLELGVDLAWPVVADAGVAAVTWDAPPGLSYEASGATRLSTSVRRGQARLHTLDQGYEVLKEPRRG